jgi:spore coat polysaccharide biosynthesis protein SpsF
MTIRRTPMIAAIVQARMSSTRLPGKVMAPILGQPMILRQLERIRRARTITKVIVATSTDPSDEPLAALLTSRGFPVFRGDLHDVLGRFAGAAEAAGELTHVVRLTADCPLTDPALIDEAVRLAVASGADYTGNAERRTYPDGLDVEVIRMDALRTAAAEAREPGDREHVTPFLRNQPARFTHAYMVQAKDQSAMRWTVDTCADFLFARSVFEALYAENPAFETADVHRLLAERPELAVRAAPALPQAA